MKKYFLMLIALIGFAVGVKAQESCKIRGAYGSITATDKELQSSDSNKGVVNFTFSNSSDGKKVNVTYSLSIKGTPVVVNQNVLVPAEGKLMQVSYSKIYGATTNDVVISISGADCEKDIKQ